MFVFIVYDFVKNVGLEFGMKYKFENFLMDFGIFVECLIYSIIFGGDFKCVVECLKFVIEFVEFYFLCICFNDVGGLL